MSKPKVTLDLLKRLNACSRERDLFAETFPDGAEVTAENVQKANEADLYLSWLMNKLVADYPGKPDPVKVEIPYAEREDFNGFDMFITGCDCNSCTKFAAKHPDLVQPAQALYEKKMLAYYQEVAAILEKELNPVAAD